MIKTTLAYVESMEEHTVLGYVEASGVEKLGNIFPNTIYRSLDASDYENFRYNVLKKLDKKASSLGADAIIDLKVHVEKMQSEKEAFLVCNASGVAVKLKGGENH